MGEILKFRPQAQTKVIEEDFVEKPPIELHEAVRQSADELGIPLDEWMRKAAGLLLTVIRFSKSENSRLLAEVPTGRIFPKKKKLEIELDWDQTYAEWKQTHPQP